MIRTPQPRSGWRTFVVGTILYTLLIVGASLVVRFAEPGVPMRVVLALAVTYGLLQAYVGLPSPHAFVVFGFGGMAYSFAALVAQRRYR